MPRHKRVHARLVTHRGHAPRVLRTHPNVSRRSASFFSKPLKGLANFRGPQAYPGFFPSRQGRCHGPFRTGPGGGLGAGVPCGAVSGAACAACSVVSIAPMLRVFDRSRRRCSARAACSWRGGAAVSIAPSASAWQRACRRYALEGGWHGLKPGSISGRLAGDGFPSARESQSLFSDPDSGREKRRHEAAKFSEAKCA